MASEHVMEFTNDNWQSEVIDSEVPVVVDFWATWCGPCRMIAPAIEEIANEYQGKVKVGKVNIDDEQDLAMQFRISSIPQVLIFQNGEEKQRIGGAQPKNQYQAAVDEVLGN